MPERELGCDVRVIGVILRRPSFVRDSFCCVTEASFALEEMILLLYSIGRASDS